MLFFVGLARFPTTDPNIYMHEINRMRNEVADCVIGFFSCTGYAKGLV